MHSTERDTPRSVVCLIPMIVAAILASPAAARAEDPFFSLRLGSKVEVIAEGNAAHGRVPIQLKPNVKLDSLSVSKAEVRLGDASSESIRDAFDVDLGTGPGNLGPAFQITVTLGEELRTGSYTVAVDVANAKGATQSENLEVVVPGATLSSPPKLVIRRVARPLDLEDLVQPSSLTLRETGDKSRARATAELASILDPAGKPIDTKVVLTMPAEIPRGDSASIGVALGGSPPPLGTTTGTLLIDAPEMATPTTLNFSIETRRSYFWIFLYLFAGVLAGYFTSTYLQARAESKEAEIQALVLMGRMRNEADKAENHSIKPQIEALIAGLQAKIDAGDAKQIVDQIPNTDEQFRNLVDGLAKRKAEVEAELGKLQLLLEKPLQLPSGVAAEVDGARQRLPEVESLLKTSDFDGASDKIVEIHDDLVKQVIATADAWRNDAKRPFDRLKVEDSVLLGVIATNLGSQPVQPVLTALDGLPLDPAQPATAEKLLDAIHKAERTCAIQTDKIFDELVAFCDYMLTELNRARPNLPQPGAVDVFEQKFAPLRQTSEEAAYWEAAIDQLLAEHSALSASLQAALASQLADVSAHDLDDETNLRDALRKVKRLEPPEVRELRKGHPGERALPMGPGGPLPKRRTANWLRSLLGPTVGARVPVADAPRLAPHPHVRKARTERELLRIKFFQMLVSMALISFVGYFLYQPNFIGTWQELAKIFFWGFGLDLGFDKVLTLTTKVQ